MSLLLLLKSAPGAPPIPPTSDPLQVILNGVDLSAKFLKKSFSATDNLWARNTGKITIDELFTDPLLTYRPVVGQTVEVRRGSAVVFGGTLDEIDEQFFQGGIPFVRYKIDLVDYNQLCDRFLVAESFINPLQTLRDIVLTVVGNYMSLEGIDTSNVDTGPLVAETTVFNYLTVTAVFNELSRLTNYVWYIDYDKKLYFKPRAGIPGSVALSKSNTLSCNVKRTRSNGPYRNRQYVRAGTARTDMRVETLIGDNNRRTFNTTFDIDAVPTITLDGVGQSVGIHGLDTGKHFYWSRGRNQVVQDDSGIVLSPASALEVTYIGRYPNLVQSQVDTEVAGRQAVEGGSGLYESLHTDPNLNDNDATVALANALLTRFGYIPDILSIVTDAAGIRSGQLLTCTFPENNVSGSYLVTSVGLTDIDGVTIRSRVTLING